MPKSRSFTKSSSPSFVTTPVAVDEIREIDALEVLHDEVRRARGERPDVEDLHAVVALDLRRRDALVVEALDRARHRQEHRVHELERDACLAELVGRQRHRAHAAFAEQLVDDVLALEDVPGLRIALVVGAGLGHG
jgi:hypothetical protein